MIRVNFAKRRFLSEKMKINPIKIILYPTLGISLVGLAGCFSYFLATRKNMIQPPKGAFSAKNSLYSGCTEQISNPETLEKRQKLINELWGNWIEGYFKFNSRIHTLSEHDLNCWLNHYLLFKPTQVSDLMKSIKEDYTNAKSAILKISNLFDDDCIIRYSQRHIQGWELKNCAIPFKFNKKNFFGYLQDTELGKLINNYYNSYIYIVIYIYGI